MRILAKLALGLATMMIALSSHATVLYGTTGAGSSNNSKLITIDTTTGVTTEIGSIGHSINGLTFDETTSTLFGSIRNDGGLVEIDTSTGAGTLIGTGFNSSAVGCSSRNVLLTSNSSGDLYGWCDPSSDDLMTIDKGTGLSTGIVGNSGIGTGAHSMAFDENDDLWLINYTSIYSISTTTGAASYEGAGAWSDYLHHGDILGTTFYGLQGFGPTGALAVVDLNLVLLHSNPYSTITLDRSDVFTVAFAQSVPAPAGLGILGLGLLGLAAARRRKSLAH